LLLRYRVTNFGVISLTMRPSAANNRAQGGAPDQASMPMVHGRSEAISACRLARGGLARTSAGDALIDAAQGEYVLGEIDANVETSPLDQLIRCRTSHRGTSLPLAATRPVRDGEIPFIP